MDPFNDVDTIETPYLTTIQKYRYNNLPSNQADNLLVKWSVLAHFTYHTVAFWACSHKLFFFP